jgi:hypothetical protein
MNTTVRRIGTCVATLATVAIAGLTLGAPAHAAATLTSKDGITAIMLSDQDIKDLPTTGLFGGAGCGQIALDVESERATSGVSQSFDFYTCLDITRDCIAQVPVHTQVNLYANNSYSCTSYSTDGTLFTQIGGLLFP